MMQGRDGSSSIFLPQAAYVDRDRAAVDGCLEPKTLRISWLRANTRFGCAARNHSNSNSFAVRAADLGARDASRCRPRSRAHPPRPFHRKRLGRPRTEQVLRGRQPTRREGLLGVVVRSQLEADDVVGLVAAAVSRITGRSDVVRIEAERVRPLIPGALCRAPRDLVSHADGVSCCLSVGDCDDAMPVMLW